MKKNLKFTGFYLKMISLLSLKKIESIIEFANFYFPVIIIVKTKKIVHHKRLQINVFEFMEIIQFY